MSFSPSIAGPADPSVIESDVASVTSSCSCVSSSVSECACGENNCYGFPQLGKFTSSPAKYDANLKQVYSHSKKIEMAAHLSSPEVTNPVVQKRFLWL